MPKTPGEIEAEKKRVAEEKAKQGAEKRRLLEQAGIYKRFQSVTFEAVESRGLPQNANIRQNYEAAKSYAESLKEHAKCGEGLILMGSYGTLKTTMAVAILQSWLNAGNYGVFVPMCSLIDNLFTMRNLCREEWARYEQRVRNTQLLVLDDLGSENTDQSWILSKVDSIITERYNKMLPMVITTNLSKKELAGTYGGRIVDRLRSTSKVLEFSGRSERESL